MKLESRLPDRPKNSEKAYAVESATIDHPHETGIKYTQGEQGAGQFAGKRFDRHGGCFTRGEGNLIYKKRGGGGDDHEEGEKIGQERANIGFELGVEDLA